MRRSFLLVLGCFLLACGRPPATPAAGEPAGPSPTGTDPSTSVSNGGTSRPGSTGASPSTSVSSADAPKSTSVSNQPQGRTPCSREIALSCAGGLVDGCIANATNVHVCVEKSPASTPCSREVALKCTSGRVDACSLGADASKVHVCAQP